MRRGKAAILIQAGPRLLQRLGAQVDAALGFCLQEAEALCCRVEKHADDVVAAHRHVAVILPAQPFDGGAIAAVRVDPFRSVDLTEIA